MLRRMKTVSRPAERARPGASRASVNGLSAISMLPTLLTFAVIAVVGYSGGGFFPRTWRLSTLALVAIAAAALLARERITMSRHEWVVVAALTSLAVWTALSYSWSSLPSTSLVESERTLLYTLAVLTILIGASRASLPALLIGAVAGVTAVSAYALARYAFYSPPVPDTFQGWHLFEPFGYANAIGLFVVLGILLTFGLVLWADSRTGRLVAAAPLLVLVPTLYYTSSRGAWVVLPIGVAAMLYLSRRLRSVSVLLALLGAVLLVDLALVSESAQGFSILGGHRLTYWGVAMDDVVANPLLGSGAGTFGRFLAENSDTLYYAHDVHNLYLETLAELGPVGLGVLLVGLGAPLLGLRGKQDALVAAGAGTYLAFLLHAGQDWDVEFAAVGLLGCFSASVVLVGTRSEDARELSPRARTVLLAALAVVAILVLTRLV